MSQKYPKTKTTRAASKDTAKETSKISKPSYLRIIKPRTKGQAEYEKSIEENIITFCEGTSGTGKTLLATYQAAKALYNKEVEKIILTKPVVEAGEEYGFLPGALVEKLDPVMKPIYDCLEHCIDRDILQQLLKTNVIEVCPLGLLRGRTFDNAFMILDEAQNATYQQLKLALTRIGEDSKCVVTYDPKQIDLPKPQDSGIIEMQQNLEGIPKIQHIKLHNADIQRSEIVRNILERI